MRTYHCGNIAELAPIYLAAILEYVTAEILELSSNAVRDSRKHTISSTNQYSHEIGILLLLCNLYKHIFFLSILNHLYKQRKYNHIFHNSYYNINYNSYFLYYCFNTIQEN